MNKSKTIDFIEAQIKQFIESRRPPIEIRTQLDFGYTYANNTLEIFEISPDGIMKRKRFKHLWLKPGL